jgi:hypothetical protein
MLREGHELADQFFGGPRLGCGIWRTHGWKARGGEMELTQAEIVKINII